MTRIRARNIDDQAIADIVGILDGWTGKLSWELLIEVVERHKRTRYTRQALHKHERIKSAFGLRKKAIMEARGMGGSKVDSPELQAALERIERLDAENQRLEAENQRLLGQFACWAYNAHTRGLDQAFLSRPLPTVNRDQTVRRIEAAKPRRR